MRTRGVWARIERAGTRQFRSWAHIAQAAPDAAGLLAAVSAAVLQVLGGVVLHAASVEWNDHVVAFVGPSGAGKSTACQHTTATKLFSCDRLAVAPGPECWLACPLPGGTAPEGAGAAASERALLPLAAVLRVTQSTSGPQIRNCARSQRVALLRQAAFHGGRSPEAELELLASLDALSCALPVATLEFGLGDSLNPIISRFIQGGSDP